MVLKVQAIAEVAEAWLKNAKEAVRRGQARVEHNGKVWLPVVEKQGRESCDTAKLRLVLGGKAEQFFHRGEPRASFRWLKAK